MESKVSGEIFPFKVMSMSEKGLKFPLALEP
nr:MAG TPA: thiamine pyrophosphokinase [Caudoviricetes sp.]